LGPAPICREQAQRKNRLVAFLERAHRGAHLIEARDRILDADRKIEEYESEPIAEAIRLLERS
jgi:hypothetical protein